MFMTEKRLMSCLVSKTHGRLKNTEIVVFRNYEPERDRVVENEPVLPKNVFHP